MEHKKTYYNKEWETKNGTLIIEGPVPSETLSKYHFHEGLVAFRPANEQKKRLFQSPPSRKAELLLREMEIR